MTDQPQQPQQPAPGQAPTNPQQWAQPQVPSAVPNQAPVPPVAPAQTQAMPSPVPPAAQPTAPQAWAQPQVQPQPQAQPAAAAYPQAAQPQPPVAAQPQPQVSYGPQTEEPRHVHHAYIWMSAIQVTIALFFVFIFSVGPLFLGGELSFGGNSIISGGFLAILALVVIFLLTIGIVVGLQAWSYRNLYYEIGDKEFSLYSGIFNKKKVHIPYQRIQSVNQRATLLQRIMGVCTINIDTAGGSSNKAVVIPYLQNTEAERVRGELFARKQFIMAGQTSAQTGVVSQAQTARPANVLDAPAEIMTDVRGVFGGGQVDTGVVTYEYGLSNKELFLTGISNNTGFAMMIVGIIAAAFGIITQVLETSIGQQMYNDGLSIASSAFAENLVWVIVGATIFGMLIIWVFSAIGTCISYGGFKAVRRQTRIEVEHGLLQHRFHGVDVDRVQSVIIKQSFIRRIFGYCELSLGKIDAATDSQQDQENQMQLNQGMIIHPFVKMDRVPEILAGLVPEFADVPTESVSLPPVSLRRALIRRCILLGNGFWLAIMVAIAQIVANNLSLILDGDFAVALPYLNMIAIGLYALCAIIAAIEAVNAVLWFKGSSFAYNRRFMQISNGGFSRESVSFPRKKIQYGFTKSNPFQRAAKVATVNVRTAAGIGGTTTHLLDVNEEEADKWLEWVIPGQGVVK